jgi:adhesin transport system outer membrane protein
MKALLALALVPLALCFPAHVRSETAAPLSRPAEPAGVRLAITALCVTCGSVNAQADQAVLALQATTSLGLRQLLQMAVETHPTVASARSEQQSAQSMIEAARMQFLPAPAVQTDSLSGRSATTFRLTQPLWTGGRLTADLRLSEVRELRCARGHFRYTNHLATRVAGIAQSYLLNAGRRIAQERNVETLSDLLRMIERRSQAEVSATADVNMVRTRLAQAQADLESFRALEKSAWRSWAVQ